MRQVFKQIWSGLSVALVSAIMYGFVVLSFSALLLLVTSMEEGMATLTDQSVGFAASVMLYGQGVGIRTQTLQLTIVPWGLTLALLVLIRAVSARTKQSMIAIVSALVVWDGLQLWFYHLATFDSSDYLALVLLKTSSVILVGYLLAWLRQGTVLRNTLHQYWAKVPTHVRKLLRSSLILIGICWVVLALCSLITLSVWVYRGQDALLVVWQQLGMQTGSRILTVIASLIWLPNLMLWAISWLAGSGFAIGSLATFSLWSGSGTKLPAIPLFAIFPTAMHSDVLRIVVMLIPAYVSLVVLGVMLISRKYYRMVQPWKVLREKLESGNVDWKKLLITVAAPLGVVLSAIIGMAVITTIVALASNGSLSFAKLDVLGVNIAQTTSSIVRPFALGSVVAWGISVLCLAGQYCWCYFAVRVLSQHKDTPSKNTQDDNVQSVDTESKQKEQEKEQTVSVSRTVSSNIHAENAEKSKESTHSTQEKTNTSRPTRSVTSVPIDPSM